MAVASGSAVDVLLFAVDFEVVEDDDAAAAAVLVLAVAAECCEAEAACVCLVRAARRAAGHVRMWMRSAAVRRPQ